MGLKLFNDKCEGWECLIERNPKVTFILSNKKRDLEVELGPEVVWFSPVVEGVVVLEITCMQGEFKTGHFLDQDSCLFKYLFQLQSTSIHLFIQQKCIEFSHYAYFQCFQP